MTLSFPTRLSSDLWLQHPYEPKLHVHAVERRVLDIALREALEKNQLHLADQPVVIAVTGAIEGFEALIRWNHPELGSISPAKFIPLAEEARLIGAIGEWGLRTACMEARNWPEQIRVAVNVSAEQLGDPSFVTASSDEPPSELQSLLRISYPVFFLNKQTRHPHKHAHPN